MKGMRKRFLEAKRRLQTPVGIGVLVAIVIQVYIVVAGVDAPWLSLLCVLYVSWASMWISGTGPEDGER